MYFWFYGLRKTWLNKCLESPVSEASLTKNVVNRPKPCWNLNESNSTTFIDPWEANSLWESLPGLYAKSWDSLLTHWLLMASILFLTEAIYCNIFRSNYLRHETYFLNFSVHFQNLDLLLNIFNWKLTLIANVFLNLWTRKNVVR